MEIELSDDQKAIQENVRRICDGFDDDYWTRMEAQGGFPETVSSPGAIAMLALLVVGLVALPTPRIDRTRLLAIGLIFGYVAWSYLSILWAGVPGDAWEGANRTLLYVLVFALFATWRQHGTSAALLLCVWTLSLIGPTFKGRST